MSFFYQKTKGVNADIDRHRKLEKEMQEKIAEYETKTDKKSKMILDTYRNFLIQLQQSKADVLSKLGRKK